MVDIIHDSQELINIIYEPYAKIYDSQELINIIYEPLQKIYDSQELINVVWTPDLIPGVDDQYTKALLHFNGNDGSTNFIDETGKIWTSNSAVIDVSLYKFGNASGSFNGDSYISTPDHVDFDFSDSDFTVEFWMYPKNFDNDCILFSKRNNDAEQVHTLIQLQQTTGSMLLSIQSVGGTGWDVADNVSFGKVNINDWNHIGVARTGSAINMFVNGILNNTVYTTQAISTSTAPLKIGGGSKGLQGNVAEAKVSKNKGRWSENFVPPGKAYEPAIFYGNVFKNTLSAIQMG